MKLFALMVVIAAWAVLYNWHPVWGSLGFLAVAVPLAWVYVKIHNALILREAAGRIEPCFVVSRHPGNGAEVEISNKELEALCLHVPYKKVAETVEAQKALLFEAGNSYYTDERLTDEERLPVVAIIFGDGKHVNETWQEFEGRVSRKAASVRADWHEGIRRADKRYYMIYRHNQTGVKWN